MQLNQENSKVLILLRGNSGSGKTTLAKELQEEIGNNTLLLSQDVIRREILYVKDGQNSPAISLLKELLIYGYHHQQVTILEGILHRKWYDEVFQEAKELYGTKIIAYYYDLSFEETLKRHQTRQKSAEFGAADMKRWWLEKDYLTYIEEKKISSSWSLEETKFSILKDLKQIRGLK